MTVRMTNLRVSDASLPMTVYDACRHGFAYAGIHGSVRENTITNTGVNPFTTALPVVDYVVEGDYTGSAFSSTFSTNLTGAEDNVTATQATQSGSDGHSYGYPFASLNPVPVNGKYKISYRILRFSNDPSSLALVNASVFANNRLLGSTSFTRIVGGLAKTFNPGQTYIYANGSNQFTPTITEFAEWFTIDPGENPIGGINRLLEGRYINIYMRFDGSILLYRPRARSSVKTYTLDQVESETFTVYNDTRGIKTHLRILGAYVFDDFRDEALAAKYGYRFAEVNNPYLMSVAECRNEAERVIRSMKEDSVSCVIEVNCLPTLEPEDRIVVNGGDYVINGFQISYTQPQSTMSISLRGYGYA